MNKDYISNWVGGHFCDTLAKNMDAFCQCYENLMDPEYRCNGSALRQNFKTGFNSD